MKQNSAVIAMPGAVIDYLPRRGPVDLGGILHLDRQLEKEAAHHPHREGQADQHVDDDQHELGVEQAKPFREQEQRHHRRDRRRHADRQHPERQVETADAVAREGVAGEPAEDHRDHGRAGGDHGGVDQPSIAAIVERRDDVFERERRRPEGGRIGQYLLLRLHRGDEDPPDRKRTG
jgi:hypothetical protein